MDSRRNIVDTQKKYRLKKVMVHCLLAIALGGFALTAICTSEVSYSPDSQDCLGPPLRITREQQLFAAQVLLLWVQKNSWNFPSDLEGYYDNAADVPPTVASESNYFEMWGKEFESFIWNHSQRPEKAVQEILGNSVSVDNIRAMLQQYGLKSVGLEAEIHSVIAAAI